jgi:glycosyltransferase involved in cell wall biosynthesis
VDNDRVKSLLMESDAFVMPCRDDSSGDRDGIPVVLMEAMACGLPVVSGDLPAIRELVHHDQNGLLVNGTDAGAIATAISRLADDPALRQRLGKAGRQRVVDEFSLSENVSRVEQLLSASISTRGGKVPITSSNQSAANPAGREPA